MPNNNQPVTGGCHCGTVRYEATGAPLYVPYCHCETCRKTTGAPVVMFVMFKREQVSFTQGERKVYRSSPAVERTFCPNCGSPISYEGNWGGQTIVEFYVSTLDDPERFVPDRHVFYGERIGWFDVADRLPRFNGSSSGAQPDSHGPGAGQ
jgi:hypothetical protein